MFKKLLALLGTRLFGSYWVVKRSFHAIAGKDCLIDFNEWKKTLGIKNNVICRRMFDLVDTDRSGFIDFNEFKSFIWLLKQRNVEKRLKFVFHVYDLDGDGYITGSEAKKLLESSLSEQDLTLTKEDINKLVDTFVRVLDRDRDRKISETDFITSVSRYPGASSQLDKFTSVWVPCCNRQHANRPELAGWLVRISRRFAEIKPSLNWLIIYLAANVLVMTLAVRYQMSIGANESIQFARAAGAALNLNMALVLVPMFRSLWAELRHTFVARMIKIDKMMDYHKVMGYSIVVYSIVHIIAHLNNYRVTNQSYIHALFFTKAGLTGVLITLAFAFMMWGVIKRARNREWFSVTHLLYGGFIAGLLLHGPVFWLWFLIPASILTIEALMRYFLKTRSMKVVELKTLADGVTAVHLSKPKSMHFYPGDFVRLQIPLISPREWHPFTISAAPESSTFAVHVRNIGDWSGALHNLSRKKDITYNSLTARIDGPYSAPTSSVYRSRIAVLVAGGIGVTPFASVLHSILLRNKRNKSNDNNNQVIYFHWLNRSQKSYEWFIKLLASAEKLLGNDRFHLHIHLTSLNHNLTNIAMQIALDAFRIRFKHDPLTKLKAQTSAGRPDWYEIFADLSSRHPCQPIDVYFCGPPELASSVKSACRSQGFFFHQERFD